MEIKLYTTGCPKCRVLKNKLEERDVAFTVVDSMKEIMDKGFSSMPVLEVNGSPLQFSDAIKWVSHA